MNENKLVRTIMDYMESWMLLRQEEDGILLCPGAAKTVGVYPREFSEREEKAK
ncbi:MAG: hypothetical protein LUF34_09750 [Lachnospiraceae bacterium]|nr:hypothetical protein [Lachnospiraceae bacterium]